MSNRSIPLLKVNQWNSSWEPLLSTERKLPDVPKNFFIGSMRIQDLRMLASVPERTLKDRADKDSQPGYQRSLEIPRSRKVAEYVRHGFPISSEKTASAERIRKLVNPGWLPGAIIVNIRKPNDPRLIGGDEFLVPSGNLVSIEEVAGNFNLIFPEKLCSVSEGEFPIEIIDGQHRVFCLDQMDLADDLSSFEVPVVFFYGLDIKWQAYLFWVINVEPKKINASLAFDLYPELRRQDWLEEYDDLKVYREHRAQEITEQLWRHELSPWKDRIELLGNRKPGSVSNAAFIRSLLASFIKNASIDHSRGGLFGSVITDTGADRLLPWSRAQQAAFLILIWDIIKNQVMNSNSKWVTSISDADDSSDLNASKISAFSGKNTLLATDQGVRAIHSIFNNYLRNRIDILNLSRWCISKDSQQYKPEDDIRTAYESLRQRCDIVDDIYQIAKIIINEVDWRLSTAPGIEPNSEDFYRQSSYRGSSGYKLFYDNIESKLAQNGVNIFPDLTDED